MALALRDQGFEVFDTKGPVVTARGTVQLFEKVFGAKLVLWTRRIPTATKRTRTITSITLSPDSEPPSPREIPGAAVIAVAEPPEPLAPAIPPPFREFSLRLPGDIAQVMGASATHRLSTPLGQRATGGGVAVAVIDTGFGHHPYYAAHGYRITRLAAPDATDPELDVSLHGTCIIAGLLACAPDVDVIAIKQGDNPVNALDMAANHPGVRIVSLSWGYRLDAKTELPSVPFDSLALWLTILWLIFNGITVIVSAGNGHVTFPAVMPEVIAVGGVDVRLDDSLEAWRGGTSFVSATFKKRKIPDLCGLAARTLLPIPALPADPGPPRVPASPPGWESIAGGTSLATCQVAGIAALLVQKDPALTPQGVRDALMNSCTDVVAGRTAFGDRATKGKDLATGAGLVNALKAWASLK